MRRALVLLLILAFLAGGLSLLDVLVKDGVQTAMADRIEARSPGSKATVHISSFPFVGRILASGLVPALHVAVTNLRSGSLILSRVDLDVQQLKVDRHQLSKGVLQVLSIRSGTVVATVPQSVVDAEARLPVRLGDGTVSLAGVTVPATARVHGSRVTIAVAHLRHFSLVVPVLQVLPCVGTVVVVSKALRMSCHFTQLPGLLAGQAFHA